MGQYLVRRLLQSIVVVLGVTLISFFSLHLAGDPTLLYVSERATTEQIELTRHNLGFDRRTRGQQSGRRLYRTAFPIWLEREW